MKLTKLLKDGTIQIDYPMPVSFEEDRNAMRTINNGIASFTGQSAANTLWTNASRNKRVFVLSAHMGTFVAYGGERAFLDTKTKTYQVQLSIFGEIRRAKDSEKLNHMYHDVTL